MILKRALSHNCTQKTLVRLSKKHVRWFLLVPALFSAGLFIFGLSRGELRASGEAAITGFAKDCAGMQPTVSIQWTTSLANGSFTKLDWYFSTNNGSTWTTGDTNVGLIGNPGYPNYVFNHTTANAATSYQYQFTLYASGGGITYASAMSDQVTTYDCTPPPTTTVNAKSMCQASNPSVRVYWPKTANTNTYDVYRAAHNAGTGVSFSTLQDADCASETCEVIDTYQGISPVTDDVYDYYIKATGPGGLTKSPVGSNPVAGVAACPVPALTVTADLDSNNMCVAYNSDGTLGRGYFKAILSWNNSGVASTSYSVYQKIDEGSLQQIADPGIICSGGTCNAELLKGAGHVYDFQVRVTGTGWSLSSNTDGVDFNSATCGVSLGLQAPILEGVIKGCQATNQPNFIIQWSYPPGATLPNRYTITEYETDAFGTSNREFIDPDTASPFFRSYSLTPQSGSANTLSQNLAYAYTITALTSNGEFNTSNKMSGGSPMDCSIVPPSPDNPSPLTVTPSCSGANPTMRLNWSGGAHIADYVILRGEGALNPVLNSLAIVSAGNTQYTDGSVAGQTTYTYQVQAFGYGPTTAATAQVSAQTYDCTIPVPFTVNMPLTTACAAEDQPTITLSWSASANAESYEVWRGATQVGFPQPTDLTFTDTAAGGLLNNTDYTYTVNAVLSGTARTGTPSDGSFNPLAIRSANCQKPEPPASFTATFQCTGQDAQVSLAATASASANVTSYQVRRTNFATAATATVYNQANPPNGFLDTLIDSEKGQIFTYAVYAIAGTLESDPRTAVPDNFIDWCATATPDAVTAAPQCNGTQSEMKLNWQMSNETNLDGFSVKRETTLLTTSLLTATARTYTDTSPTLNTSYTYDIVAQSKSSSTSHDTQGSVGSPVAYNCATPQPVPSPLTLASGCSGNDPVVYITADASPSDTAGNDQVQNYGVWRQVGAQDAAPGSGDDKQVYSGPTSPSSKPDASVIAGDAPTWYVAVQGHNGQWSGATSGSLTVGACAPSSFTLNIDKEICTAVGAPQVDFSWFESTGVTSYTIKRDGIAPIGGSGLLVIPRTFRDTAATGLVADGTTRTYMVDAANDAGTVYSNPATSAIDCRQPDAPIITSVTPTSCSKIDVTFASDDTNTQAYKIYRTYNGVTSFGTKDVPGTYNDSSLNENGTFTYQVCALGNYALPGEYCSGTASATTPPCSFAIALAAVCVGENEPNIVLTWTNQEGADTYQVWRSGGGVSSTQIATLAAGSTQFVNNLATPGGFEVQNGTDYSFTVKACAGLVCTQSNTVSVDADCTSPPTPTLDAPTAQCNDPTSETTLNWTMSDTSHAAKYHIYKWIEGDVEPATPTSVVDGANTLTYTDGILTGGATYHYKVRAEGPLGLQSGLSGERQAAAAYCTPTTPDAVAVVAACNGGDPTVALTWDPDAFWGAQYEVTRNGSVVATAAKADAVTTQVLEGEDFTIKNDNSLRVKNITIDGKSVKRIGYGMWYNSNNLNTNIYGSYHEYTFAPKTGPYEFTVYARSLGSVVNKNPAITVFLQSQANESSMPYVYGESSSPQTVDTIPSAIWKLYRTSAVVAHGIYKINIACGPVYNGNCKYNNDNSQKTFLFDKISIAQANWQETETLPSNTAYTYGIKTIGLTGSKSGITNASEIITPACTPNTPNISSVISACNGPNTNITVQWSVSQSQPGVTYQLYRTDAADPLLTVADDGINNEHTYVDVAVGQNVSYTYYVKAIGPGIAVTSLNASATTPWCNPDSFTIAAHASCRLDYTNQGPQVALSWEYPHNVVSYDVYRSEVASSFDYNNPLASGLPNISVAYTDTTATLALTTEYVYQVKAVSNAADILSTESPSATTPRNCSLPPSVMEVTANPTCGSGTDYGTTLTVTIPDIAAVVDNYEANALFYAFMVQRCDAGGTCVLLPFPSGSPYLPFAYLSPSGTTYTFTLINSAANNGGFTSEDDVVEGMTYEYTVIPMNTYAGVIPGASYTFVSATVPTLSSCAGEDLGDILHVSSQMCVNGVAKVETVWKDLIGVEDYQVVRHESMQNTPLGTISGSDVDIPDGTLLGFTDGNPITDDAQYEVQSIPPEKTSNPYPYLALQACDANFDQSHLFGRLGTPTSQLAAAENCTAGTGNPAMKVWWYEAGGDNPSQYYMLYKEWFSDLDQSAQGYCYDTAAKEYSSPRTACATNSECTGISGYCRKLQMLKFSNAPATFDDPYIDASLVAGEVYTYKVVGYRVDGASPFILWESVSVTAPTCLPAPDPFTLHTISKSCTGVNENTAQVKLAWNDTTNTQSYYAHYALTAGGSVTTVPGCVNDWSTIGSALCADPWGVNGTSYTLSFEPGAVPDYDMSYDFWISAVGQGGSRDSSCAESGTCTVKMPICTAPPIAPNNLTLNAQTRCDRVTLTWVLASQPDYAESYRLYRCEGAGCDPVTQGTLIHEEASRLNDFTDVYGTNVSDGTVYRYQIAAHNTRTDTFSPTAKAVVAACAPPAQGGSVLSQCPDHLTLTWDADNAVDGYTLTRKLLTDADYIDAPLIDAATNGYCYDVATAPDGVLDCTTVAGKIRWTDVVQESSTRYVYKVESIVGDIMGNAVEIQARACPYFPKWHSLLPNF